MLPVQGGRFVRPPPHSPSLSLRVDSCTARVTDKRRLPAYTSTPSGSRPEQAAAPKRVPPGCGPDRGREWPPWSSSAARPSPFFGRVVPQPRVFALLPAPRARHIPRYVVGEAPPPRLAGVPHPRRRTVGLKSASAGLRTLEAASPAAAARFSSLPLCGEALPRLSAEGNRRGAGRAQEPTVARESFAGPA